VVLSLSMRGANPNWGSVIGMMAGMFCLWSLLIGPQIVRQDLRQDLQNADVLKMYPMHGWQLVLGEILAPALILTGVQWLLLMLLTISFPTFGSHTVPTGLKLSLCLGAAVVFPVLNLILLLIPNAACLLFPAWFQSSRTGAHGIEATGQRLIFAIGQFLAFAVSLLPAAAVFAGLFFVVKFFAGVILAVPVAATGALLVLGIEAGLGLMLLGRWFERFDVSAEMTA
jgi:hypothetical protein